MEFRPEGSFGNPKIDYIVQLEMKTVKLNEMRTLHRNACEISEAIRCVTGSVAVGVPKGPNLQWKAKVSQPPRTLTRWLVLLCVSLILAQRALATDTNTTQGYLEFEYQELHKQFQAGTNNAELAWKLGRACFDMSTLQKDASVEANYAQAGIDACQTSLALDARSAPAHYYLGMDIGQLADTKRNLAALRMVKDMEREFLTARSLDKHFDQAGPSRNLGLLYRDAPTIVSIGSRTKARQYLEEAVELAPDFPENQLNLIESYLKWDYKTEAQRQFGELEKMWPRAQKEFIGVPWQMSWTDWNKRLEAVRKKIEKAPKNESPHAQ